MRILDSSVLVAFYLVDDVHHARAVELTRTVAPENRTFAVPVKITCTVPVEHRVFAVPMETRSLDLPLEIRSFPVWPTK